MATRRVELGRAWDDEFRDAAEGLLLGRRQRVAKGKKASGGPRSSWSGAAVARQSPSAYPGRGSKQDLYGRLDGIARKHRQVVVKITGGGKSTRSIRAHFDYLTRNGELALVDQDGRPVDGREALRDLSWAWKHGGPQLDDESPRKEAFNIVFSMPEGTDPKALHDAVKATAEHEFAGHQWVMVQHFDEPQVHAHVCVKAEALDGTRLNPRKADLQRWRERFAYELRERGVEAEATRRAQRMQREKVNTPWPVTRLQERGEKTNPAPAPTPQTGWAEVEAPAASYYDSIITALRRSDDVADRELAQRLATRMAPSLAKAERSVQSKELERG